MIPAIWPISVAAETALALRLGGFPALRRFLVVDVAIQCGAMALADSVAYQQFEAVVACVGLLALAPAVWELQTDRSGATLAASAIAALAAFMLLADPAYSVSASLAWGATALFHSLAGIWLLTGANSLTAKLFGVWLLGDAVLFYVAPWFPVGLSVLWWNLFAWLALFFAPNTLMVNAE